jgi:HEAT repeat protein
VPAIDDIRDDPRSTSDLLALLRRGSEREYEYVTERPSYDRALAVLHQRGTRDIFVAATAMTHHPAAHRRALGCSLLGELGRGGEISVPEIEHALLEVLNREAVSGVRGAALTALGHTRSNGDLAGRDLIDNAILGFVSDPDPYVRGSLAFALAGTTSKSAIDVLLTLMEDSESVRARNWATTTIRSDLNLDSPTIREALFRRALEDPDDVTRGEALHGLAARKDARAIPLLIAEFERDPDEQRTHLFAYGACVAVYGDEDRKVPIKQLLAELRALFQDTKLTG